MLNIALLHYPVYNKEGRIVTTSIANMDIHDIARISRTYDIQNFFVINPVLAQRELANQIVNHWQDGYGGRSNPSRRDAFMLVRIKETLAEACDDIIIETGCKPKIIVTGAKFADQLLTCSELKKMIRDDNNLPYLIIFGTGWGIASEIVDKSDYRLEPIQGCGNYNHLAVRSAVAIIIDRIMGT